MIYGYFTRILPRHLEEYEFLPPLEDYFEVIHSITPLDKVVYDTNSNRFHLKQLVNTICCENKPCKIQMLSLFNIGRHAKDITLFLLNLPKNVELYLFDDKVDIYRTIKHICTKYWSIHDLITCDDYIKVKTS